MKYVKRACSRQASGTAQTNGVSWRVIRFATLLTVLVASVGCGTSNPSKDTLAQEEPAPELIVTRTFLPVDEFGKDGVLLPYETSANPYGEQKGRIKKQSVAMYIDARRAFKAGDYEVATSKLNELLENDKALSGPWVMLGDIALRSDDTSAAQAHFEKAIEVNPENVNAYLRLAKVLRINGEFIASQNVYAETLGLWKDFPEAHLNLAILYDIYLDKPMLAQQHMEAYLFLNSKKDEKVAHWLQELRGRTGVAYSIEAGAGDNNLSMAGDVE
ncbi:Tetratricopeptide repeat-containing protein [Alteromonadaceae bacterium Bs31]|nr:Tetratricopeptide repeat-containing protein [Alteromonadaceae bacterium Bs31]